MIIRLYQDVYKIGNPQDYDLPKADINDGMNITRMSQNNKEVPNIASLDRYGTNLYLPLADKLNPGGSLSLSIDWNYRIPTEFALKGSEKCGDQRQSRTRDTNDHRKVASKNTVCFFGPS